MTYTSISTYAIPEITLLYNESNEDYIIETVADYFKLKPEQLKQKVRYKHIVIPRQIAMYLYNKFTRMTLTDIASLFGNMNHATVIHSIRSVNNMMDTNYESVKKDVEKLNQILK